MNNESFYTDVEQAILKLNTALKATYLGKPIIDKVIQAIWNDVKVWLRETDCSLSKKYPGCNYNGILHKDEMQQDEILFKINRSVMCSVNCSMKIDIQNKAINMIVTTDDEKFKKEKINVYL